MSGIKKFWKRLTKRSPVTEHTPDWTEYVDWFVNHPARRARRSWTSKENLESRRMSDEARARLTPEQFEKFLAAKREGVDRVIERKPPLPHEELVKIFEEKKRAVALRKKRAVALSKMKKSVKEEAARLVLKDPSNLNAEIEEWAASIDRDKLRQWVIEDFEMWKSRRRWREKDVVDMKEIAKDMIESEFDNTIKEYNPIGLLLYQVAGYDPPEWKLQLLLGVFTHGNTLANEAACSTPLLSAAHNGEMVDWSSMEFKREAINDIYLVEGRLRKMKELYMQVMVEMGLEPVSEPEEACEIIDVGDPVHLSEEEVKNDIMKQVGWLSGKHSLETMSENARINLSYQDAFLDSVDEIGLANTKVGIEDNYMLEPDDTHYPIWLAKLMHSDWDLPEAKRKVREMKELYILVMRDMGLLEPASEPEAEKVEAAQAPTDRGIEWVRATFHNKLKTLDVDIDIDFFNIEEIEDGRMLVKGKGYLERPIWGAINDMVRSELGGRYDSSERGWVIEK